MSTYKVIQDIEAEDKLVGPLSFRQFVYALVCVFCLYLSFIAIAKHVPFLLIVFLPPALFTGFFAFPFGGDQPTEIWAVAKIRFLFKPRKRIWDQSGVKELVSITVPKKIERVYTNGLSQNEVRSRLSALADTIDSRGWAIKNVNVNLYSQAAVLDAESDSDRLIGLSSMPQAVPDFDINAADDILDERSNPVAQQFDQMIHASSSAHHQELIDEFNGTTPVAQPPATQWFQPPASSSNTPFAGTQMVQPGVLPDPQASSVTADEQTVVDQLKARNDSQQQSNSHLRTIQPLSADDSQPATDQPTTPITDTPPVTDQSPAVDTAVPGPNPAGASDPSPAILNLANNNDLNVATLAREAQKAKDSGNLDGEVVISLR